MRPVPTVGLVLAGGRGSRMGGDLPKPLVPLQGRPLLAHVLGRLAPQVDELLISALPDPRFGQFGHNVVIDRGGAFHGPASGIGAAMSYLRERFGPQAFALVSVAGDSPFLPLDLVERLASKSGADTVVVATRGARWVPTFALWPSEASSQLGAVTDRSLRSIIDRGSVACVEFGECPDAPDGDPFFNINTPDELHRAERLLGFGKFA